MNEKKSKPLWLEAINKVTDRVNYHKEVMTILENAGLLPDCTYYYYSGVSLNKVENYEGFLATLKRIKRTGLKVAVAGYTNYGSDLLEVSLTASLAKGDYFYAELRIQVGELEESLRRISKGKCHITKEMINPNEFEPYEHICVACES